MREWTIGLFILVFLLNFGCGDNPARREAQAFLDEYTQNYKKLAYDADKASWLANTDISDRHDSLSVLADKALSE
ncbi:MAG: hypothetical protein ACE5G1_07230, partial [bacterium]